MNTESTNHGPKTLISDMLILKDVLEKKLLLKEILEMNAPLSSGIKSSQGNELRYGALEEYF